MEKSKDSQNTDTVVSTPSGIPNTARSIQNPGKDSEFRNRTLREQYLLEKERIKFEIGDLEQIRISLGYSQRRMCQLLLVDPSAWTRWTKTLSGAPPHVYQALKWLVELKKVNPDAAAPGNLSKRVDFVQNSTDTKIRKLEDGIATLERIVAQAPARTVETSYAIDPDLKREVEELKLKIALLLAQGATKAKKKTKKRIKKIKYKAKTKKTSKSEKSKLKKSKIKKKNLRRR